MQNPFSRVHEGMDVMDHAGHHIGKVDWVKMSDEDPDTPAVEQVTVNRTDERDDSLIDNFLEAFRVDEVPEELHENLLRQGFIRIDADGIFAADRYVTSDQIADIANNNVILKVGKDQLIRRQ